MNIEILKSIPSDDSCQQWTRARVRAGTRERVERPRRRTGHAEEMKDAKNCIYPPEGTSEAAIAMPSHMVNFTEILILCRLGVDSNVEFLNKLTLAACRENFFLSDIRRNPKNNWMRGEQACLVSSFKFGILWWQNAPLVQGVFFERSHPKVWNWSLSTG